MTVCVCLVSDQIDQVASEEKKTGKAKGGKRGGKDAATEVEAAMGGDTSGAEKKTKKAAAKKKPTASEGDSSEGAKDDVRMKFQSLVQYLLSISTLFAGTNLWTRAADQRRGRRTCFGGDCR